MIRKKKIKKRPAHKKFPPPLKIPRGKEKVKKIEEEYISWHLRILDKNGDWSWRGIDEKTIWEDIHSKLSELEKKTWNEILIKEKYRNHLILISKICPRAQERLRKIKQDDIDELVSLRLTGKKRVWGIKERNILKVLWWDPYHTVCPSIKSYT
ncbi:hypothetical protein ES703_58110 [subsurface metagenome]